MQLPRITKSIFLDQFIFMQLIGLLIGLSAPFFWLWYGIPSEYIMNWSFFLSALFAGQAVGLVSYLLISTVIRPHLKLLAQKMKDISEGLENKTFSGESGQCDESLCQINTVSNDEIGVTSKAYNQMLYSLLQAHEVELVYTKFTKVMSENLELLTLSESVLELLIHSTHVDAAAILVVKNGELKLISSNGIVNATGLESHEAVNKTIKTGVCEKFTLPQNIQLDGVLTHFNPSEIFINPIEFKGVKLGVMIAATGAHISDERTEHLINLFSRSLGLAINNALTHAKFQKLAAVDGLTNIYNRRFGMDRLKEDYSRAVRDQSNIAVAMVDIDHFKKVNDTYGHLVGDKAIILTSSILKGALRDGDIVVRYGGEEFLMILHGATSEDATMVCERIRNQIQDSVLKEGDQEINLTISIGVAAYPAHAATNEVELIDMADQALYSAKKTGRNKVVQFGQMGQ